VVIGRGRPGNIINVLLSQGILREGVGHRVHLVPHLSYPFIHFAVKLKGISQALSRCSRRYSISFRIQDGNSGWKNEAFKKNLALGDGAVVSNSGTAWLRE
jgi:hypothetical protein